MELKAVLFDVDGTLADTEEAHRQAFNAAFRAHGLPWEWDTELYRELLTVAGGKERIRHYCARFRPAFLDDPRAAEIIALLHADKTRRYAERAACGGIAPRPGVVRLVRELHDAGVRLAIATTTSRANVDALLATSLRALPPGVFELVGAGEDVAAKKPSPAIYAFVLQGLRVAPADCLAIEDSRNGLLAALAAGVPALVTECPWTSGEDFAGALVVLSDLGDPGRPHRCLRGAPCRSGYADADALFRWHAAWRETARGLPSGGARA